MTLKEIRISKGLNQLEASSFLNIPVRTYKRLENDLSYISSPKYKYALDKLSAYSKNIFSISKKYKIAVIGAGYVGLSLGVLLSINNEVSIIDINEDKINKINKRISLFKDKEIETYLSRKKLNLKGYLPDKRLYIDADYIFICVPTDYDETHKRLDTSIIESLIKDIREVNKTSLIIIKSTCYIGFTESLNDNNIIFCPEFLREGRALLDNLYPSRIIVGGDKKNKRIKELGELLRSSSKNNPPLIYMSSNEAEAVKLFSNSYLAMRVSFFNELDSYSLKNKLDSNSIIQGISLDPRIGDYYNNPSFGFGGYCLPKDTLSLINQINDKKGLISSIDRSNQNRKEIIAFDIINRLKRIKGNIVGVYSVESKKDSDNIRHAAILDVIDILKEDNIDILYFNTSKMDIGSFKNKCDLILLNRNEPIFNDVKEKIYTRDLFFRD